MACTRSNSHGLRDSERARFASDGYLVVEQLFSAEEMARLRERGRELAQPGVALQSASQQVEPAVAEGNASAPSYAESLRKLKHVAADDAVFLAHAGDPRILDIVEQFLGPDIVLASDNVFMKPPRVGSRQNYHQDALAGFFLEPPEQLVSCWCAIDRATIENGCLWMIPGSHRGGPLTPAQRAQYALGADGSEPVGAVPVELQPGGCVFHHGLTLHGSRANASALPRWGYATHYASARCRPSGDRPRDMARPPYLTMRGRRFPGCL